MWDVTLVGALASNRLNQGSLCNPETTTTEAEARQTEKHRELKDFGYSFQSLTMEVQGSLGESSEIFVTHLYIMHYCLHDHQRDFIFVKHYIPIAFRIGNEACV